jgi:hypothetical protein
MAALPSLTHVDLRGNRLTDTGVRILATPLCDPRARHITHLDVSDNSLPGGDEGFADVLRRLAIPLRDETTGEEAVSGEHPYVHVHVNVHVNVHVKYM